MKTANFSDDFASIDLSQGKGVYRNFALKNVLYRITKKSFEIQISYTALVIWEKYSQVRMGTRHIR